MMMWHLLGDCSKQKCSYIWWNRFTGQGIFAAHVIKKRWLLLFGYCNLPCCKLSNIWINWVAWLGIKKGTLLEMWLWRVPGCCFGPLERGIYWVLIPSNSLKWRSLLSEQWSIFYQTPALRCGFSFFSTLLIRWTFTTYFAVHIEVPVDSSGSIQESIPIISDAAVHQALWVQVGTHGLSLPSSCHPRHTKVVQHICTLQRTRVLKNNMHVTDWLTDWLWWEMQEGGGSTNLS